MNRRVLCGREDFEVLDAVVALDAVDVVNVLVVSESPAEVLFHNETVFSHVSLDVGAGMIAGVRHDVAGIRVDPAALPVVTVRPPTLFAMAGESCRRVAGEASPSAVVLAGDDAGRFAASTFADA